MIYKVIEDAKWEYKVVCMDNYDVRHNQMDALCGGEGWEAYSVVPYNNSLMIFLKRSYKEIERNFSE